MGVERRKTLGGLSSVLGGRSNVRGSDEPLLNLGLLVGRVLVNIGQTSPAVLPLATHLSLGEERLRQLDHVALKLGSLRVGLLQKRSGLVVEGSHVAHVGDC